MAIFTPLDAFKDCPPKFLDEFIPLYAALFRESINKAKEARITMIVTSDGYNPGVMELAQKIEHWEAYATKLDQKVEAYMTLAPMLRDLLSRLAWIHETVWYQEYMKKDIALNMIKEGGPQAEKQATIMHIEEYHANLTSLLKKCHDQINAFVTKAQADAEKNKEENSLDFFEGEAQKMLQDGWTEFTKFLEDAVNVYAKGLLNLLISIDKELAMATVCLVCGMFPEAAELSKLAEVLGLVRVGSDAEKSETVSIASDNTVEDMVKDSGDGVEKS